MSCRIQVGRTAKYPWEQVVDVQRRDRGAKMATQQHQRSVQSGRRVPQYRGNSHRVLPQEEDPQLQVLGAFPITDWCEYPDGRYLRYAGALPAKRPLVRILTLRHFAQRQWHEYHRQVTHEWKPRLLSPPSDEK